MPVKITLQGIVGYDITAADIRAQLAAAAGPVDLLIHSPGGSVFEGVAIYNAIRDHRRAGHAVTATVTGIAASMATYIAMSADSVAVEDNAVFMIHNASGVAMGDARVMTKSAEILGSINGVLNRAYQAKTGRDATEEMDAETWLFGQEIVDAGYADRLIPAGEGPEDRTEALALARGAYEHMTARLRQEAKPELDQIAALLPQPQTPTPEANMADDTKAAPAVEDLPQDPTEEQPTEPTPDDAIAAHVQAALAAERRRVSEIQALCAKTNLPDLAAELIANGSSLAQANARVIDAWVAKGGPEIRQDPAASAPTDFETKVSAMVAAGQSRAQAIRAIAAAHPELHRAYLARVNRAA